MHGRHDHETNNAGTANQTLIEMAAQTTTDAHASRPVYQNAGDLPSFYLAEQRPWNDPIEPKRKAILTYLVRAIGRDIVRPTPMCCWDPSDAPPTLSIIEGDIDDYGVDINFVYVRSDHAQTLVWPKSMPQEDRLALLEREVPEYLWGTLSSEDKQR